MKHDLNVNGGITVSAPASHLLAPDQIAAELKTTLTTGLTGPEAAERLARYGPNQLVEEKKRSIFAALAEQFSDFLVIILLVAAVLSFVLGEVLDGSAIMAIVILNAILGVVQEFKADQALANLKKLTAPKCRVLRDGEAVEIDSRSLVPGDVVLLDAGDPVPADLRLTQSVMLKIDESLLTGESVPVEKDCTKILPEQTPMADRVNLAFMSTWVTFGHGQGVVTGTGMQTEVGRIAGKLQEEEAEATPLQQRLSLFGKQLGVVMLIVCAVVGILGLWRGMGWLHVIMVAVSLAVATIPEGLPAVVTIVLAMGTKRMAERNAVIRRLSAVETLGSATVICSDKTGTLTQNKMTVTRIWTPEGWVEPGGPASITTPHGFLLAASSLCNDASLSGEPGNFSSLGDPTETALVIAAANAGLDKRDLEKELPRLGEVPFSSERKRMTTFHALTAEGVTGIVKGAPDLILARCNRIRKDGAVAAISEGDRASIEAANHEMAHDGIRVLAVALTDPHSHVGTEAERLEQDLLFVGLIGMTDPPRVETAPAVAMATRAGIRSIMITGDHLDTAVAIGKSVGIATEQSTAYSGAQLDQMSDADLDKAVQKAAVFARVSPEHKLRIVESLRRLGEIVAMTGDGVNDAPALKRADIGVAMGLSGTGVAKGAADMVLMDDNFATIVHAIEEGRTIYANIQKFAFFLLSANLAELLIMTVAIMAGMPLPLEPIHLLWINLITDSLPAIALGMEATEPGIMLRRPRDPKENVITRQMMILMITQGVLLTAAVLGAHALGMSKDPANAAGMGATYAFATLTLAELFWAHGCRNIAKPAWSIGFFANKMAWIASGVGVLLLVVVMSVPALEVVFQLHEVHTTDWIWIVLFSLGVTLLMEPVKALVARMMEPARRA